MSERIKRFNLQRYGALIVLALMVVLNGFITPNFLALGTLWNVLIQAFPVILMALGMTMVIATGGIDISVGSTMAISSIILAKLSIHLEWPFAISLLIALLAAAAFGLFNGVLVGVFNLQPIISTLILMVSGRGIAQLVNDGVVISFYGNRYTDMGVYRIGGMLPVQVVMIVIAVAVVYFVVNRTSFGCYLQAVGDNGKTARLTGIRTSMILICVYLLCALLAGFAASFETLWLCSADPNNIGNNIELDCVAAVAVGGTSMSGGKAHVIGTVIGALVMQLVTTIVNMNNIPYAWSLIVKAAIIVIALYHLSIGATIALTGILAAKLSSVNVLLAILAALAAGAVIGLVNAFIVTRLRVVPFIATLAVQMAVRGIAYVITDMKSISVTDDTGVLTFIGRGYVLGIPFPVVVFIVVALIAAMISTRTAYGRSTYAIGGNENAARMMGIRVERSKAISFTATSVLSALAGVILCSRLGAGQPLGGQGWEMDAIVGVAIGGTLLSGGVGGIGKTVCGVLIMGFIKNIINLQGNVNSYWQNIIMGLIILAVIVIQNRGKTGGER